MSNSSLLPTLGIGMLIMLGVFLLLALRQQKNVTSVFQYHLYGDDLKENRFTGSLISTNASLSGAFVLILYYGFLYGPWAFPFVWAFWVITQTTSAWTIERTQVIMEDYGKWENNRATLHEFIGLVFASPQARRYGGILSLFAYLGLIAAEIVLAAHLLDFIFPNDTRIPFTTLSFSSFMAVTAIMLFILIYNVLSGFRGTVQTDFAQWIIMSFMILLAGIFILAKMPMWGSQYASIFNSPTNGIIPALFNPDHQGYLPYASFCLSNIVFWGLWWPGAMDQWQRCAAARKSSLSLNKTWGTIGIVPVIYFGILSAVFLGAGVWLRVSQPDAMPSPSLLSELVVGVLQWSSLDYGPIAGLVLCAIVFWGLVCAAMSTIDGYVMTASQSFFVDVVNYKRGSTLVELNKEDSEKKQLKQARAYTIFIPLLVIVLALVFSLASDVYALIYFSFSFMFALLPSLFAGLKKWATPQAARACVRSLVGGGITSIIGYLVIIIALERALRANNTTLIFRWYQAVYWWPVVVTMIGSLILWASWPKKQ